MAHVEKAYILYLSVEEAELLRCFVEKAVNCNNGQIDPQYEDWDWEQEKAYLKRIASMLPEAI